MKPDTLLVRKNQSSGVKEVSKKLVPEQVSIVNSSRKYSLGKKEYD